MGSTMRVLGRWMREFAAGVDAGHAILRGLPVPDHSAARYPPSGTGRSRHAGGLGPAGPGAAMAWSCLAQETRCGVEPSRRAPGTPEVRGRG